MKLYELIQDALEEFSFHREEGLIISYSFKDKTSENIILSHADYAVLETSYSMLPQNVLINFPGAAILS